MATGFCCVAGIAEKSHEHIRPVLGERLPTGLLAPAGGAFDMGALVELGPARPIGRAPELEDHLIRIEDLNRLGFVSAERLWAVLNETASPELGEIFGPALVQDGPRASVPKGRGIASLGCFRPGEAFELVTEERAGEPRLRALLPELGLNLSVTDARFYHPGDYSRIDRERVGSVRNALRRGDEVLLGVGLTRPFSPDPAEPERHWLQVNAIHVREFAGWRLAR